MTENDGLGIAVPDKRGLQIGCRGSEALDRHRDIFNDDSRTHGPNRADRGKQPLADFPIFLDQMRICAEFDRTGWRRFGQGERYGLDARRDFRAICTLDLDQKRGRVWPEARQEIRHAGFTRDGREAGTIASIHRRHRLTLQPRHRPAGFYQRFKEKQRACLMTIVREPSDR